jgi:hypothetical protein
VFGAQRPDAAVHHGAVFGLGFLHRVTAGYCNSPSAARTQKLHNDPILRPGVMIPKTQAADHISGYWS